ncbi:MULTISPECIES: glycosyltransferase [Flavobacteriaceae]|nr:MULTISPECIES: glycosyltransferase [Flavobacteriaceae]
MKKIKILYTIPNFDTAGSGKVVYDLVKNLDKNKFKPEICCFHNKGGFFKEVEKLGVKIHIVPFTTSYKPYATFPMRVLKISRFLKRNKFDIIHSWHWSSDFSEPLAAKLAGIKYVYTKKAMSWGNKAWVWRSKLSSEIITINNDMLLQFFNAMQHKIVQIPLGVDVNYFKPIPKSYKSPEIIEFKKEDFIIVSVANLVAVKGIELLLTAIKNLDDATIKILIIGDDSSEYGQNLSKQFTHKNIYFLGKKMDVRPYLALADLFIIPTKDEGRKEGMPIAPLEAMAMGKIVLGSKISGIKDILKEFPENLFEAGNIIELERKIVEIKSMDNNTRKLLEAKTRKYVVDNLSIDKFIYNHEKFYTNLMI